METLSKPISTLSGRRKRLQQPDKVFVYGTLKRGEPNAHVMRSAGGVFLTAGTTVESYPLVVASVIPYLLPLSGKGKNVHGEVYEVPLRGMLFILDALEGHPDWYCRSRIRILGGDQFHTCWTYFLNRQQVPSSWDKFPFLSRYTYHGQPPPSIETKV